MNKKFLVFALLLLALLAMLFVVMTPIEPLPRKGASMPIAAPGAAESSAASPGTSNIRIEFDPAGKHKPDSYAVDQGTVVSLKVISASDDELHVHGYDLEIHLEAGKVSEIIFNASHAGRFEMELHRQHVVLGVLEVVPE